MRDPKIRYCRTEDDVDIAYTITGEGPPLLYVRRFMAPGLDDELTFSFSNWGPLARVRSVVLFDIRGSGLSGPAPNASFDDWIKDIEAVVGALGVSTIDFGAELTPCHFAIAYATRHPEVVGRMVLWNPAPKGFSPRSRQTPWLRDLAALDWESFADVTALRLFGWQRAEAGQRFAERLRRHFNRDQYEHLMDAIESIEVADASGVRAPTLVITDLNFFADAWDTSGPEREQFMRRIAAQISSAELTIIKAGDFRGGSEAAVRFLEPDASPERASSNNESAETAIILFADIADSTALTEGMGDALFRERARALDASLRQIIASAGGTAIEGKLLGDGVLATFPAASQAIDAALRCGAAGDEGGLPLHLGIHAGDVIREQNNVFGGAVNIASRISGLSAPGEVLVSDVVRALARTSASVTFEDRGEHALKGVGEPQRVYAVRASR
jgi:class 3 adenylate cyclase